MSLAASKGPSGGTALRVLRERVSSTSSRSVLYPFIDRTGPSTDSNKAADPAVIQSKMATTSRISIWLRGLVATTLPSRSNPINAGKNSGISGLMDRLRPSMHCVERAQGSGIVPFCLPKAPKRQINDRRSLEGGRPDKHLASWAHSLATPLPCWALSWLMTVRI
jgi:hypothetical protein